MKKQIFLFAFALICVVTSNAQTRYLDQIFSSVDTTMNITYGTNIDVITGMPASLDLKLDLYEPAGDTATNRPVVIVVHGGSFLPVPINNYCTGTKTDSQIVVMCTELAKYGYVVASIDYRMGWNPVSGDQDIRTGTYLNAYYRSVQDMRNAVRFFRLSVDNGNPYNITNDKFSIIGEETGGFSAVGAGSLDSYNEISLPKFINPSTMQSYIDTSLSGNSYGTEVRPLNMANYPTYSSDMNFIGNLGGAVGDSTWIEAGEPPVVSLHTPSNPFIPYSFGAVIVQTTGDFLINVSGSYHLQQKANSLGNNDVYINAGLNDNITQIANAKNDGVNGLFPFYRPSVETSPWHWWDTTCISNSNSLMTNPDMSESKALAYTDTILWYLVPRMAYANDLVSTSSISETDLSKSVLIFPNPASEIIEVYVENNIMHSIALIDITGRVVYNAEINENKTILNINEFDPGVYFVSVSTEYGLIVKKMIIE